VDAVSVLGLGRVFTANMTGNIVFLGFAAAGVPGFIGFAVGRTAFWDPLVAWRAKKITREDAVNDILGRYRAFVDTFERQK
jgi:myo-inositol catabolism protein IolC